MPADDVSPDASSDDLPGAWPGHSDVAPRFGVAPRSAIAAGLLALLGLIVCAWLVLRPVPQGETLAPRANPVPAVMLSAPSTGAVVSAPADGLRLASAAAPGASGASGAVWGALPGEPGVAGAIGEPAAVSVYVVGQVRSPGVVSLASGARVVDAIAAAGGATDKADLAAVNLARKVSDGEQILIPRPGQAIPITGGGSAGSPATPSDPSDSGGGAGGSRGAPLNLNTATQDQLDDLPGVGPVIAGRIIAWRTENGQFASVSQLGDVSGIGDATLAKLRPLVTV